jgi:cytochrome c-type biogenesis protein CcmH
MRFPFLMLAMLALVRPVLAVLPSEQLADPKLEARARAISQELRCVVCQNQTIDDSDATLAHDLRVIVRERLEAGDSDEQVKAYIVKRYGAYVLLKPPLEPATILLWFGPLFVLLAGAAGSFVYLRRRRVADPGTLSSDEELEVSRILAHGDAETRSS